MKSIFFVICALVGGLNGRQLFAAISFETSEDGVSKIFIFESAKPGELRKVTAQETIPIREKGLELDVLRKINKEASLLVERETTTDVQKFENSHVRSALRLFNKFGDLVWELQRHFVADFLACSDGRVIFVEESGTSNLGKKTVALVVLDKSKKEVFRHSYNEVGRGFKLGSLQINQNEDGILGWTHGEIVLFLPQKNKVYSIENAILGKSSSDYAYKASFHEDGIAIKWTRLFEDGKANELESFYDMELKPSK